MKHISRAVIAVALAVIVIILMPAQVFADSMPEYISEVKVYIGSYKDAEKEGYTILSKTDENGNPVKDKNGKPVPVDLNQGAGGGVGSKGDKAVYLGYKTTTKASEAITDLALMNMKGGYSVAEYEVLMESQMKSQIIPFVENFLTAINEYRDNLKSDNPANKQRAEYIKDALNKLIDDDTGKGLGDLLVNETKFEMGDEAYNKLSDEEKKEHADILTIIAQSNGKATLLMETLITKAADTDDDNWFDRFSETTYDELLTSVGGSPTDAERTLARAYDDDASAILSMWDDFRETLLGYDEAVRTTDNFDEKKAENALEAVEKVDENTPEKEGIDAIADYAEQQLEIIEVMNALKTIAIHDRLAETEYGDGTMLDFFTTDSSEIEEDISVLYPLVASLSEGQRAGLDFVDLNGLFELVLTDENGYNSDKYNDLKETSIYNGVDRAIYQKGGVALTSDTLRTDAFAKANDADNSMFSPLTITMMVLTGTALLGVLGSVGTMAVSKLRFNYFVKLGEDYCNLVEGAGDKLWRFYPETRTLTQRGITLEEYGAEYMEKVNARMPICSKLAIGFTIATVIFAAVTTYLTYRDLKDHYKVDFTPIPHYMVDERDIVSYNEKGEKIVIKNQSAYYKAVQSNLKKGDFKFDEIGALADMNGCVGQQWLALYAVKNEAMDPILASSVRVVVGSSALPAGYSTGVHMFGSKSAFNLNSNLYDWNESAKSIFVYFKTDNAASSTTATTFTGGTLALTGGAGLVTGAVACAFAMKAKRKKAEE